MTPPRVLVVRLGAIGDALRVLPAVRRLRRTWPEATLGWAVEQWVYPLLAGNPNVDRFHVLDRGALRAGVQPALTELRRFFADMRAADYDIALDFHGRFKSGVVSRLSGAAVRIGYARGQCTEGNHWFTNVHVQRPAIPENRVERFLHLLEPLHVPADFDARDTGLYVDDSVQRSARAWYERSGGPVLAVYPGTSRTQATYHRWPAENWAALLQQLSAEGTSTVVFWGPDDADFARTIAAACVDVTLAPRTTLPEMMAMIACCRAFIGANTAAMHMAWLQGVPTAVFTGPADPRVDAPLPPVPARVLRADAHVHARISKRHQPQAVAAVPVEAALDAVRFLLAAGSTSGVAPR